MALRRAVGEHDASSGRPSHPLATLPTAIAVTDFAQLGRSGLEVPGPCSCQSFIRFLRSDGGKPGLSSACPDGRHRILESLIVLPAMRSLSGTTLTGAEISLWLGRRSDFFGCNHLLQLFAVHSADNGQPGYRSGDRLQDNPRCLGGGGNTVDIRPMRVGTALPGQPVLDQGGGRRMRYRTAIIRFSRAVRYLILRIPTMSAGHSELMSATCSDRSRPAIPIESAGVTGRPLVGGDLSMVEPARSSGDGLGSFLAQGIAAQL